MTLTRFLLILLTLGALLLTDQVIFACNSKDIMDCLRDSNFPASKNLTEEVVRKTCRASQNFLVCIDAVGCGAVDQIKELVKSFLGGFQSICGERLNEYLPHANCLASNEVKLAETICALKYGNETDTENNYCQMKSRVMSCVVGTVMMCCGSEASGIYFTFHKQLAQPVSGGCQIQSDAADVTWPSVCLSTSVPDTTVVVEPTTTTTTVVKSTETTSAVVYTTTPLASTVVCSHSQSNYYSLLSIFQLRIMMMMMIIGLLS